MKGVVMSSSSRTLKAKGEAYGTPHAKSSQKMKDALQNPKEGLAGVGAGSCPNHRIYINEVVQTGYCSRL